MENDSVEMVNIRLKELAKVVFGSLKGMDLALGRKQGYLSNYINQGSMLGGETLQFLAKNHNVNINWLLTGKGSMLVNSENVEVSESVAVEVPILTNNVALELIEELRRAREERQLYRVAEERVEYK